MYRTKVSHARLRAHVGVLHDGAGADDAAVTGALPDPVVNRASVERRHRNPAPPRPIGRRERHQVTREQGIALLMGTHGLDEVCPGGRVPHVAPPDEGRGLVAEPEPRPQLSADRGDAGQRELLCRGRRDRCRRGTAVRPGSDPLERAGSNGGLGGRWTQLAREHDRRQVAGRRWWRWHAA